MKAVFLDRDGVINELLYYEEAGMIDSPFTVEQFHLLPGVGTAIHRLNNSGFLVIVASNQPGIAKNHFDIDELAQMTGKMESELKVDGAYIDKIYYCVHHPEGINPLYSVVCKCRKPEPGLLLQGISEFDLDPLECYMIGDNLTDIQAGRGAGCQTILIGNQKCEFCHRMEEMNIHPYRIAKDLPAAVDIILETESKNGNLCRFGEH
jgi:D-glycero-D-manno-heptose 1,7-bisphosphate phosphatase